jgi:hypothetical protein
VGILVSFRGIVRGSSSRTMRTDFVPLSICRVEQASFAKEKSESGESPGIVAVRPEITPGGCSEPMAARELRWWLMPSRAQSWLWWRLAILAAAPGLACTSDPYCSGNEATPVTVTVVDSSTGLYVCDAQVSASDGSSTFAARPGMGASDASLSDASCNYPIYPDASGTYTIDVSAPGLSVTQPAPTVALTFGKCGYEGAPNFLTVVLQP